MNLPEFIESLEKRAAGLYKEGLERDKRDGFGRGFAMGMAEAYKDAAEKLRKLTNNPD